MRLNPRRRTPLVTLVLALVASLVLLAPAPATGASSTDTTTEVKRSFKIASLNLHNRLGRAGIRHDIRRIARSGASVIGLQERRDTKRMVRRALPDGWRMYMPTTAPGTDDNPIIWNNRVWELKNAWPRVLARKTWRRNSTGQWAITQWAPVVVLEHRKSGHVIRAASFHMPNLVQRRDGGPNYNDRIRLEAFWRMAKHVRSIKNNTPASQQFVAMCDCNVSWGRDWSRHLVKGELTNALGLDNNYTVGGKKTGWQIDYVMAARRKEFAITGWKVVHDLATDHPGVVTRFAN